MKAPIEIKPFLSCASDAVIRGIDDIFFVSSNTQSFANDAVRAQFRERWLGRYLSHDPCWAYVASADDAAVAGYLVGSIDDPARTARFADITYFAAFNNVTRNYPAHLHVNVAPAYRNHGLGGRLIEAFAADLRAAGVPGVHVVTSRGARNVGFYARFGFHEADCTGAGEREVVFLARQL
jgi:GNAT superfamily N-acetyltransferase